jgi:hypothetical protein
MRDRHKIQKNRSDESVILSAQVGLWQIEIKYLGFLEIGGESESISTVRAVHWSIAPLVLVGDLCDSGIGTNISDNNIKGIIDKGLFEISQQFIE